jgi:hypothetical protein
MKKAVRFLMILMLVLSGMTAAAAEKPEEVFDASAWQCDRAYMEIFFEEEGYRVFIEWGSSAWESRQWDYSCHLDRKTGTLISLPLGSCTDVVYADDGSVKSFVTRYEDGSAEFSLDDQGYLIWKDLKEDAGRDMRFERIPLTAMEN